MTEEVVEVFVKLYSLFCERCGLVTGHRCWEHGDWETYTCILCGCQKDYRVR